MNPETFASITVVIPVYNKRGTLLRAVTSVLAQTPPVAKVVVVDDGSKDDSMSVLNGLVDPRVQRIRQANGGVSAARNRGFAEAGTDWVAFLDADDEYLPGFIEQIQILIRTCPEAAICATAYQRRWSDGQTQTPTLPDARSARENPYGALAKSSFFSISSSACVRRALMHASGIRFPVGESLGEDQDVTFRLLEVGTLCFAPEVRVIYYCDQLGSLSQQPFSGLVPCFTRLAARVALPSFPHRHRRAALKLVAVHTLNVARAQATAGQRRAALKRCLSVSPWLAGKAWLAALLHIFGYTPNKHKRGRR